MNNNSNRLSIHEERLIFIMQLLGDKTRYKMFKILASKQELCVSELAEKLGISASAVSQHFKNFEMTGIVDKMRSGQKICYVLRDGMVVDELKSLIEKNNKEDVYV